MATIHSIIGRMTAVVRISVLRGNYHLNYPSEVSSKEERIKITNIQGNRMDLRC